MLQHFSLYYFYLFSSSGKCQETYPTNKNSFSSILGMNLFGCKFCKYIEVKPNRQLEFECSRKNFDSLLWAILTVFQVIRKSCCSCLRKTKLCFRYFFFLCTKKFALLFCCFLLFDNYQIVFLVCIYSVVNFVQFKHLI